MTEDYFWYNLELPDGDDLIRELPVWVHYRYNPDNRGWREGPNESDLELLYIEFDDHKSFIYPEAMPDLFDKDMEDAAWDHARRDK